MKRLRRSDRSWASLGHRSWALQVYSMLKSVSVKESNPVPLTVMAGPFRGAGLVVNPDCSKRKLFGIYEHVLNSWWRNALPRTEVFWDIGASDGYFTFGCAHALKKYQGNGYRGKGIWSK